VTFNILFLATTTVIRRIYFIIIVFTLTAQLLLTVYLRSANNRLFFQYYQSRGEQSRLKQQLGNKQLQVEAIINPASVWKSVDTTAH
jgi:hypothetical protein